MNLRRFFRSSVMVVALAVASATVANGQASTAAAEGVLRRLMPGLAGQFRLVLAPRAGERDYFRISGTAGHIEVAGGTVPTLLYGVNWYLKYVAHLQVSSNGLQLGAAGLRLPAPVEVIERPALYRWRYALNQNVDGYTSPYWDETRWQHEIDVLAMSGTNAVLIERGTDLVLYETFRDAGYSDAAMRAWITTPAHQNWQLMGNMCCFNGPMSMELLQKRAKSAQRLVGMLRELGMTPVLPGYYGIVPADFAKVNAGAHVITQGDWNGFTRPGWIDPRDAHFAKLAESFYRHQHALFGDSAIYNMEVFQEGGRAGDVPVSEAAVAVQKALQQWHPGALWMMMAWQKMPSQELLASLDKAHVLIADIEQGRIPRENRDKEFGGAGWLFGGLWEFGGRTTMGAPLYDYAVRMPTMAAMPGSRIEGTAIFTEGMDTNPVAFDLYTEMAWHAKPVDLGEWMDGYAWRRYGAKDDHAERAWQILLKTAYGYRADGGSGERDAGHDSLFDAQPSLTTTHAATWSPAEMKYDAAGLRPALTELLEVAPALRGSETYKYDVVDVARQVMANEARTMLPEIKAAYEAKDKAAFARLTGGWLERLRLQDALLQTNEYFLLGRWMGYVPGWASSPKELERLNYDAKSILTTWGDRHASDVGGLHEYANKDWAGLTSDYYLPRWKMYFDSLSASLASGEAPKPIDWFAFGDAWNHSSKEYRATAEGDSYAAAMAVAKNLGLAPGQVAADARTGESK